MVFPLPMHIPGVSLCVLISSCKDSSQIGLGPTPMALLELNHLFGSPISKYNHILSLRVKLQHMILWEDTIQSITWRLGESLV